MHKKEQYCFIKKRFKTVLQLFFLFLSVHAASAQVIDTVKTVGVPDTVILKKTVVLHSPKKASLYSTMCPGLGQAYNKKYWKIPVLYAGFAGFGYLIYNNQKDYIRYRTAYRQRLDGDPATIDEFAYTIKSADQLLGAVRTLHRWRDLSIFGTAMLYLMNIVDASVDAHLFSFDVSDDLSLNYQPVFISTASINKQPVNVTGLSIHINF
jgi:hypothetical protein